MPCRRRREADSPAKKQLAGNKLKANNKQKQKQKQKQNKNRDRIKVETENVAACENKASG
ncbi:MAG: hypothetical protein A2008_06070 [Candidatus Wallbacteria bacterium GWC2_49_35]|uniref:Uncharacterized protein n=1 Tax=Candidatus Wallbacteria bacterium GWC2_49_35 TaxID=1817813 RepID=A0A1F7WMR9_9BACT|nr:MAG: hypothetical protein A2008_06070 [Candidatus Wallbacteria bacterium GWC2_49_35]